MGNKKKLKEKDKKQMATETWIQYIEKVQHMIERQDHTNAIKYFHEDIVCMGPGENDRFEGKDALLASWKENFEMMPMIECLNLIWMAKSVLDAVSLVTGSLNVASKQKITYS